MKRNLFFPLLLCLLLSCQQAFIPTTNSCTPDNRLATVSNHPKTAALQAKMDEYLAKGLPGMTFLISTDEGIWINSGGFADLETQLPMQPCHINKLGSVTKMMIGTLVWLLIQDGVLDIDDPISQHIPEVAEKLPYGDQITLAMLVNHSSGIYDVAGDLTYNLAVLNDFTKSWTSDEILTYLEGKEPTHEPGTQVKYSNSNTMLVGLVIEAATGRTHTDLLQERIFDLLGMTHTVYYDYSSEFPKPYLAQGYLDFNNDGGSIQNISDLNPGSGNGFTGVYSTVTDLYLFLNALLREKTLISPENLERIFASMQFETSGRWRSSIGAIHDEYRDVLEEGIHAYGHAGGDIGYSSNLSYFPHNNAIFAATYNYGTNLRSDLGKELSDLRKELIAIMAE